MKVPCKNCLVVTMCRSRYIELDKETYAMGALIHSCELLMKYMFSGSKKFDYKLCLTHEKEILKQLNLERRMLK